jgi:hypothetical protein
MDTQEQLAWEARHRPRAGAAAMLAGILSIGGALYVNASLGTPPKASVVESLARLPSPRGIGSEESLRRPFFMFVSDHVSVLINAALLSGAALFLLGIVLAFLARAARARLTPFPKIALTLPLIGGIAYAVGLVVTAVGTGRYYDDLVAVRTVDGVQNAGGGMLVTGQSINLAGALALGAGLIMVCLNAMRAGLLTRFMGVLGMLCGGLIGLSPFLGTGFSPVQAFWMVALGLLFLGRVPGGEPPAWASGTAIAWPSSAETREARLAARGRAPAVKPEPEPAETTPKTSAPSPATSKKKRKRRG